MELKDAFKELERFAGALARGATVRLVVPPGLCNSWPAKEQTIDVTADGSSGVGFSPDEFIAGWRIKEIIEPKVLRDWTAEDAKKFEGYAFRMAGGDSMWIMRKSFAGLPGSWVGYEYAAPIPGTDPAKWDWKPCKVEVPASETPKPNTPIGQTLTRLAALRARIQQECALPAIAQNFYAEDICQISAMLEQVEVPAVPVEPAHFRSIKAVAAAREYLGTTCLPAACANHLYKLLNEALLSLESP